LLAPRPTPLPEDQASISPRGRVATHFSRLLQHAWVTVGLFLFPGLPHLFLPSYGCSESLSSFCNASTDGCLQLSLVVSCIKRSPCATNAVKQEKTRDVISFRVQNTNLMISKNNQMFVPSCDSYELKTQNGVRYKSYGNFFFQSMATFGNSFCQRKYISIRLCLTKHHAMKTYWGTGGIAARILRPRQ
jgi:hypothetical protein